MSLNPFSKFGRSAFPLPTATGKLFWVASDASELSRLRQMFPADEESNTRVFETLDAAINASTANRGDVIYIAPGHAETVAGASGITADVAGLTIIGLGEGADRPTFTFSATASTIVISGASTTFRNFITVPSIDSVVSPIVVSAADVTLQFEHRDASSTVEAVRAVLTTAGANNLKLDLVYRGFTAGNAVVNAVRLVGGSNARVKVDFYGVASTAVVEFLTTAVVNARIEGYFYNSGTTNFTKTVVDTVTGSTWAVEGYDGAAGARFNGSSGSAITSDDVASLTNTLSSLTSAVNAIPKCVEKPDGAVLGGVDNLFVITGGPVRAKIVGIVTTTIGGAANANLQIVTTSPAATVSLNAAPVAIDNDAAGTSYHNLGATSVFTPVTAGIVIVDPVTVEETSFILPIGTVGLDCSAPRTGVIKWYMTFEPLSPASTVSAAA